MAGKRFLPNFPSRRSLHGKGADNAALERALEDLRAERRRTEAPTRLDKAVEEAKTPLRRRSLTERFAEMEKKRAALATGSLPHVTRADYRPSPEPTPQDVAIPPTPSLGVPVGAGEISLPGDSFEHGLTGAYSIIRDGVFDPALTDTGLVPVIEVIEEGDPLTVEQASEHHLFVVSPEITADEIEALAVSIWDDAAWAMPGTLRLVGEAYLRGPWRITPEHAAELGLPRDLTNAWLLETPRVRAYTRPEAPVAHNVPALTSLQNNTPHDPWAAAFPDGVPLGLEYKALLALLRMARRLGGALRIRNSGYVMAPIPQSAVHMGVYAPRWVEPGDLCAVLKPAFPQVVDSRDIEFSAPLPQSRQVISRVQSVLSGVKPLSPEIQEVLRQAREEAAKQPQRVDGYALLIPQRDGAQIVIEVHRVMRPPRVLRWEKWTNGTIIEYAVRWNSAEGLPGIISMMESDPDSQRLEQATRVSQLTEAIAVMVARATGGSIVDEDGFLVGFEEETNLSLTQ